MPETIFIDLWKHKIGYLIKKYLIFWKDTLVNSKNETIFFRFSPQDSSQILNLRKKTCKLAEEYSEVLKGLSHNMSTSREQETNIWNFH